MSQHKIKSLQNSSNFAGNSPPTIVILPTDENWDTAYTNWKNGKNPTNHPDWKKGIFLCFEFFDGKST
jgi:hypothetical protein